MSGECNYCGKLGCVETNHWRACWQLTEQWIAALVIIVCMWLLYMVEFVRGWMGVKDA